MAGIADNLTRETIERDLEASASRGITAHLQKMDGHLEALLNGLQAIQTELATDAARTTKDDEGNDVPDARISDDTITEINTFLATVRDGGLGASGETHLGLAGVVAAIDTHLAQEA